MTNYEKLINTLKEVFMLDKAELDFGIYRIMNQKRKDIEQFLEIDLVPQVQKVLSDSLSVDKQALQKELDDAIKSAQALGADPNTLPKVQQLKTRLGEAADMVGIENEVFSLLANFFKRYFDNGDFISMRRYKQDVYSIPYEGEEVKLHWANADQYYIKTSEYFKFYRFKLTNGKTVVFELVEASTEQNNNKSQGDKERRFAIYTEKSCELVGEEFKIYFTYEPTDKKIKQSDLLLNAFDVVKSDVPQDFSDLLSLRPTEKDKQRTLLQKHFLDYTARNTFDYFIHKDLGGFLTRELDFYIKNEVLFIDDLNTRDEQEFLKQLSKIKAIKKIGEKIITFLAQLENFQKKLWLKKKMVVECNYCITLDRVPKELYREIIDCQEQLQEWVKLFAIDEIKKEKANSLFPSDRIGFSNPLSIEFLNQNQFLVLDTIYFSELFKWKLIGSIENFDEKCNGLLINSDNFQALKLIANKYKETAKSIFIDPPYNTESDRQTGKFIYKDGFSDSSWITMMYDRVQSSSNLLNKKGLFFCTIDDNEVFNLKLLCDSIFNPTNFKANIIWNSRKSKQNDIDVSLSHNYITLYSKNKTKMELYGQPLIESEFDNPDKDVKGKWKVSPLDAPGVRERTSFFPIINPNTKEEYYPPKGRHWTVFEEDVPDLINEGRIFFGVKGNTKPQWKRYWEEVKEDSKTIGTIWDELDTATNATKELENIMGHKRFETPKPSNLLEEIIQQSTTSNELIIDYFAGSGTTAHAVIKKNREGISARYILCEMGDYFDKITKERVVKVIYSKDWKEGKPLSREGISHCFKYMRLESYEDTLNNLTLKQTETQQKVLEINPIFKEGYMLNYMLDVETQGNLLNLEWFVNPFNCFLNITHNNEMQPTKVDLVETFNYLIGLIVENYAVPKEGYVVVTGKNLEGESILVVWRDCTMHNSTTLNTFLEKSKYNPLDSEYDRIYVNGDNNVENLKTGDERWKVVLIEEEFKKRMFENL